MRKFLFFAISTVLLLSLSNKTFAICAGATSAGALSPNTNWQTTAVNTYRYYTFVATYPGETFVFSFCDGGGSNSVDTQIEIYTNAGVAIAGAYNDDHCGLGSELVFSAPAAGTYRVGIYQYYCSTSVVAAGVFAYRRLPAPTSADCLGALPLCNLNNSHPVSASGEGNYYDLYDFNAQQGMAVSTNNCPNCLVTGEDNNMWYTFVAQTTGTVNFTIAPVSGSDDYDWAVFSLNGGVDCFDLVNYSVAANRPVICNYCGNTGNTGVGGGSTTCEGPNSCSNWNSSLNVVAGRTYVVNVSNFSASTSGYSINFGGSATIVDNTGPSMSNIVYPPVCGQSSLTVQFSERLWCGSVQPADFILTGPAGTYNISDTWSAVCEAAAASTYAGTFYDDLWTLELADYLAHDGNYTLTVINGGVNDICNNFNTQQSINFTINGIESTVSHTNVTCNGANNGSITVGAPSGGTAPYLLTWSGPVAIANNNYNPTNLPPGAYIITISDAIGQCEFVETVTITQPTAVGYNSSITHPTCGGGGND
ncbi:MAG: SprB repeat-containing protein, partial [Bacteroidales bacterium]|nr:SprB repeat-containing protein [Bacteroidales bacterium]